jgi:predicted Co/Zn/Cd cation transporter (cation efflux family)
MQFAVGINLVMALTGAIASWICNAQALALDGLVSGLNALMILVGARLSNQLLRSPHRRYPFGYWALETLYTGSRSLLLLGILLFASITSIDRILGQLHGA